MKTTNLFVLFAFAMVSLSFSSLANAQYTWSATEYICGSNQTGCDSPPSDHIVVESYSYGDDPSYSVQFSCPNERGGVAFAYTGNYYYHEGGSRAGQVSALTCYYETSCPPPMSPDGETGACVCPDGFEWNGSDCVPQGIDGCTSAIMSGGGNGSVTVNPDNSVSCSVGDSGGSCTGTFADEACFSTPTGENGDECSGGNAFGTVNGSPVCVGSGAVQETGTSDASTWGESTGSASIIWEETSVTQGTDGSGNSVTQTQTSTATSTPTSNTQPIENAAPYTCDDGRAAANAASCDSTAICDPGYYLVFGACVPLPAETTTETVEQVETTTTTTNNDTGEETTETTSSNTTKPGDAPATTKVEVEGLDGPCNPSEPGYLDCVSGEPGSMPDHTDNGGETLEGGFQTVYTRMADSPIVSSFQGVASIVPDGPGACQPFSIDLTNTIIGQNVSTSVHCDIAESVRGVLGTVMIIFYTICGFRIFASA